MVLESSQIDWILLEFIALLRSLYNFDKEVWSSFISSFPFIEVSLLFIPKNQIIKIKKMNNITIIYVKMKHQFKKKIEIELLFEIEKSL